MHSTLKKTNRTVLRAVNGALLASCLTFGAAAQAGIVFEFDYSNNAAGVGFLDATDGAARQQALTSAGNLFSSMFGSYFSNSGTLKMEVTSISDSSSNTLASAGSYLVDPSVAGINLGEVVKTKLQTGVDLNGSSADGTIDVNFGWLWQLDPNTPAVYANSEFDFFAAIAHELTHALGFSSTFAQDGSPFYGDKTAGSWSAFDSFLTDIQGNSVINPDFSLNQGVWDVASVGGSGTGLIFNGANAIAANGGNPVHIYSPNPWEEGSSSAHLDETIYNTMMMKPTRDYGFEPRVYSALEVGVLTDLGYTRNSTNAVPEPGTIALLLAGMAGVSLTRRRKA